MSHLGGIFSAFNVSTVKSIDFFKSSFPARYGGRISSITDIEMNYPDFEKFTGKFTLGLLSANMYITTPLVKKDRIFHRIAPILDRCHFSSYFSNNESGEKRREKNIWPNMHLPTLIFALTITLTQKQRHI
ncbi:MAG: hypothetical protein LIP05_15995 [Tannerellaceae bacterium]|nr:hypothetical protein [Tannerellaceae bacterium]